MIKLLKSGSYQLVETKDQTKMLLLDRKKSYAWIKAAGIGSILVFSQKSHLIDHTLAVGKYRMYEVDNEPNLVDLVHLELLVGEGAWQGYLLPTGMPVGKKKRSRITATKEIITKVIN